MKLKTILFVAAIISSGLCFAAESDTANTKQKAEKIEQKGEMPKGLKAKLLKEFDKDKDGFLNKEELDAAKKVLAERQAKFEEMQKRHAERIMKKYDKDGDGKLSQEELVPLLETQMRMLFEARGNQNSHQRPNFRDNKDGNPNDMPPPPPALGSKECPAPECDAQADAPRADKKDAPKGKRGERHGDKSAKGKPDERKAKPEMRRPTEADLDALAKPASE